MPALINIRAGFMPAQINKFSIFEMNSQSLELFSNSVVNFGFGIIFIFALCLGLYVIFKMFLNMQKQHIEHLMNVNKAQNEAPVCFHE